MSTNAKTRQGQSGGSQEVLDAGSGGTGAIVAHGEPVRVVGRLDTYRSRSRKWHRQVRVEQCPGCGHPHLHRAPLPLVRSILRTAPCGLTYVVQLRTVAVTV